MNTMDYGVVTVFIETSDMSVLLHKFLRTKECAKNLYEGTAYFKRLLIIYAAIMRSHSK